MFHGAYRNLAFRQKRDLVSIVCEGLRLGYLSPPPAPAPVVVVKDVGGLVSDYRAQTAVYRSEGREVRLLECRSACTLALSLPNVCVYPWSVLKFHTAYNQNTKEIDQGITAELFNSYPQPVRERLGYLTRNYRNLRGEELIDLGVRDCRKGTDVQIARARTQPQQRTVVATNAPEQNTAAGQGVDPVSGLVRGVASLFGSQPPPPSATTATQQWPQVEVASLKPSLEIPLPPRRPSDLQPPAETPADAVAPETTSEQQGVQVASVEASVPTPPRRPAHVALGTYTRPIELPAVIIGAAPILPTGLSAYAPLPSLLANVQR